MGDKENKRRLVTAIGESLRLQGYAVLTDAAMDKYDINFWRRGGSGLLCRKILGEEIILIYYKDKNDILFTCEY